MCWVLCFFVLWGGGEVEGLGEDVTAGGAPVLQRHYRNFRCHRQGSVGGENILMEDETCSPALNPQFACHCVGEPQRGVIFNFNFVYHRVNPLLLHVAEREPARFAEFMARMLQIVEVVGVIHNPLRVHFVVAHFQGKLINIRLIVHLFSILNSRPGVESAPCCNVKLHKSRLFPKLKRVNS